jgi:hypothetical protein
MDGSPWSNQASFWLKGKYMKKFLSSLFVLALFSISCGLFTGEPSSDSGPSIGLSTTDFEASAEALNVSVELDESSSLSGMFTPDGSTMTLTASDGTTYTLEVPAGALEYDTAITMTAVRSISGAPLGEGAVSAVQLEPSGLFFNDFATLTISPANDIPVENQIIFSYEGTGQDYHLAMVDPISRDIKIKLLHFSGAGVGSGPDSAWAANLQIQGNAIRTKMEQKTAAYVQTERRAQLLGLEGDDQFNKVLKSDMEKYYDQVVLKEIAAAELDCQYALRAVQDLLSLERQNQLMGLTTEDADGEHPPIINGLWDKIDRLGEIYRKCNKVYTVSGESNGVSFTGNICGLDKPFVLDVTFPGGNGSVTFKPQSVVAGTTSASAEGSGCVQTGEGNYTVSINEDGNGTLQWTTTDTLVCEFIEQTRSGSFSLPLQLVPDASCP